MITQTQIDYMTDMFGLEWGDYVEYLEEQLGLPVVLVSTGPEREALVWRRASLFKTP